MGGRNITNLRFADDIAVLAEEEQELDALVERSKMEISAAKNQTNNKQRRYFCTPVSLAP